MSPLTKAFVVLVTLLSVLLAALVIPFVAKTDKLTDDISALKSQLSVANAAAQSASAAKTLLMAEQAGGNAELQAAVNTLQSENLRLNQQIATANAAQAQAANELTKATANLGISGQSVEQLTALLRDRTEALSGAQNELVTVKTQNAQLSQRNQELDAQVSTLTASIRNMGERLAGAGGAASSQGYTGSGAAPLDTANAVRGTVSAVEASDGITFIQINVGSADGLRTDGKIVIYRGSNTYVATATVVRVDGNAAVARVTQAKGSIQSGDSILASAAF